MHEAELITLLLLDNNWQVNELSSLNKQHGAKLFSLWKDLSRNLPWVSSKGSRWQNVWLSFRARARNLSSIGRFGQLRQRMSCWAAAKHLEATCKRDSSAEFILS